MHISEARPRQGFYFKVMAKKINFGDATKGKVTRLSRVPSKHGWVKCGHGNFELDGGLRQVRCKSCGEIIDPFDALVEFADYERRFLWQVSRANAAIEEFKKIQSEWSLTIREKRRIGKAQQFAKLVEMESEDGQN